MNKPEPVEDKVGYDRNRAVKSEDGLISVAVNHQHLDHLIGSLLHLCDLVGGKQGEALKSEIKTRCRSWLDDQYFSAGYGKYGENLTDPK